ncbi:MAG: FHA domain-containing serine/threonine-protein kinase [Phycisphaeraceae bacterium]
MNVRHSPASSSGLSGLTLHVILADSPEQELFVQHGLTIGRGESNAVCIPDAEVDPIHARIRRDAHGGFEIIADTPTAKLKVDSEDGDTETDRLALTDGVQFHIGSATFTCRKLASRPSVVVTANPWEVRCPRCHGSLVEAPGDARRCPDCELPVQYFTAGAKVGGQQSFRGWLPRQVGPYKVRAFVGQGGMGVVLRGIHEETDLPAAIKLPLIPPGQEEEWLRRFEGEVGTLEKLKHPNIVRLQDAGCDQHMAWLATDWVEGESLANVIEHARRQGQTLSIDRISDVLSQVLKGLEYLHGKQIIHRDLKPGNILIARDGLAKLADFGLARAVDGSPVTAVTRTGSVVGTHRYMAPEQYEGGEVTPASDIYAFGVIWYEMLTGIRPLSFPHSPVESRSEVPRDWRISLWQCLSEETGSRPTAKNLRALVDASKATGQEMNRDICPRRGSRFRYGSTTDSCANCGHEAEDHAPANDTHSSDREKLEQPESAPDTAATVDKADAWRYDLKRLLLGVPPIGLAGGILLQPQGPPAIVMLASLVAATFFAVMARLGAVPVYAGYFAGRNLDRMGLKRLYWMARYSAPAHSIAGAFAGTTIGACFDQDNSTMVIGCTMLGIVVASGLADDREGWSPLRAADAWRRCGVTLIAVLWMGSIPASLFAALPFLVGADHDDIRRLLLLPGLIAVPLLLVAMIALLSVTAAGSDRNVRSAVAVTAFWSIAFLGALLVGWSLPSGVV